MILMTTFQSLTLMNKFADDTKAASLANSLAESDKFQDQINKLYGWSKLWNMEFNVDKCHILHLGSRNRGQNYTMNGITLPTSSKEKDLGVQITNDLKPSYHCSEAARKATATLYSISRSFHFRDKHVFVKLFKQYVRPQLEYAVQLWSPWLQKDIEILERVQKRMVPILHP